MHNCENVHISDCFIRTFDDSICIKGFDFYQNEDDMNHGGKMYNTFKNVTVENCVIWNDWGKSLEIGAERVFLALDAYHMSKEKRTRAMAELKDNCTYFHKKGIEVGAWV